LNGWFGYFSRRNRVWMLNPHVNDADLRRLAFDYLSNMPTSLLARGFVVTTPLGHLWATGSRFPAGEGLDPVTIDRVPLPPFALVCNLGIQRNAGRGASAEVGLRGIDRVFRVLSGYAGEATFIARATDPDTRRALDRAVLRVNSAPVAAMRATDGTNQYAFVLHEGLNELALEDPADAASDPAGRDRTWHLTDVRLLLAGDWIKTGELRNPNGRDRTDDENFFWLGGGPTEIELFAGRTGTARLSFNGSLGPSVANRTTRHVELDTDEGYRCTITINGGPVSVPVPLSRGRRVVRLLPLERPTVALVHDPRPLVVGVGRFQVALVPETVPTR
jgi:hypothetical protein